MTATVTATGKYFLRFRRFDRISEKKKKGSETQCFQAFSLFLSGGDKRDRTADLLNAIQAQKISKYSIIAIISTCRELSDCNANATR